MQEQGDFSILQPWQPSPVILGTMYAALVVGQLAARQAALESESTNIASDGASIFQTMQDVADT